MRKARSTVVHAAGHPAIRATHSKTLELTREKDVTQRSTCVAGVAAEFDTTALGLLRGPVLLTVSSEGRSASGTAVINPEHDIRDRLVIRRSQHRDADTLAVDATLTAANLGRELVAALTSPDHHVTLDVTELEPPGPLVLVSPAKPAGRLGLLWDAADAAVDLDSGQSLAAALAALVPGGTVAASLAVPLDSVTESAEHWLVEAARHGARLWVSGAGQAETALLASGLPLTPSLRLGRVDRRAVRSWHPSRHWPPGGRWRCPARTSTWAHSWAGPRRSPEPAHWGTVTRRASSRCWVRRTRTPRRAISTR
jgi:hypothetical protein